MMTKTEARKVARRARQYGYFHDVDTNTLWNECPMCREIVETPYIPAQGTITRQLDAAMVFHLMGYCGS